MQFLGRTEFGLSVMAVERHTRYTQMRKKAKRIHIKCNHCRSFRALPRFRSKKTNETREGREWLKLVRINLINKCICFSKKTKTHHLYYSLLTLDDKNNQSKLAAAAKTPKRSHQPHYVHCAKVHV